MTNGNVMLIGVTHLVIPMELVYDTVHTDASEDKLQVCVTMMEEISLWETHMNTLNRSDSGHDTDASEGKARDEDKL